MAINDSGDLMSILININLGLSTATLFSARFTELIKF